jgi:hypothetical protein
LEKQQPMNGDVIRNKSISSDDEDMKVYNIRSANTTNIIVKNETVEVKHSSPPVQRQNGGHSPKATTKFQLQNQGEQRAASPLWTYTLPAPPKFADRGGGVIPNDNQSNSSEEVGGRGKFYNDYMSSVDKQTIFSEAASTIVTDIAIKPIIKERVLLDESLYSLRSQGDDATLVDSASSSTDIVTSDMEDGYQGDKLKFSREALLDSLDKRRDRYIENEFAFLAKADEEVVPKVTPSNDAPVKRSSAELVAAVGKRESVEERKISVLDELNNVINKKEMDSLIRKPVERDCFDAANRNSLSNFKIMSYNSVTTTTKVSPTSPTADSSFDEEHFIRKRTSQEYARKKDSFVDLRRISDDTVLPLGGGDFKKPRDLAPVQRRNLMSNSPIAINRSDSFHSTRPEYLRSNTVTSFHLTPRSSSYISLIGAQKFENRQQSTFSQNMAMNRRKSASELSICDSPSLQSLLVMKNILNSSKKNLTKEEDDERPAIGLAQSVTTTVTNTVSVSPKAVHEKRSVMPSVAEKRSESPAPEPVKPTVNIEKQSTNQQAVHVQEPAKKWKYQGPPTIQLGTWNERPKIDVCIKSDKDYKFGGNSNSFVTAGSVTLPKKIQTPKTELKLTNLDSDTKGVDVVDAVNVATSPLPPVQLNEQETTPSPRSPTKDPEHLPIVRSVEYKKNIIPSSLIEDEIVTLRSKHLHTSNHNNNDRPSYYESFSKPQISAKPFATLQHKNHSSAATQTFSVPRTNMHFTKKGVVPTVKGFKDPNEHAALTNRMSFPASTHIMLKNASTMSGSMDFSNSPPPSLQSSLQTNGGGREEPVSVASPIKSTLNRSRSEVGLKTSFKLMTFETNGEKNSQEFPFSQNTLRRTGLKEKILATPNETTTTAVPKQIQSPITPPPPPSTSHQSYMMKVPTPPAAPALKAPIVRGVIVKKSPVVPQVDTRELLMDSIRNFKFSGQLRKE